LDQRILALPVPAANLRSLQAGAAGHVYYLVLPAAPPRNATEVAGTLQRFDLSKRKGETVLSGIGEYRLTREGKKALTHTPPEAWAIVELGSPPAPGSPGPAGPGTKPRLHRKALPAGRVKES